MIHTITNDVLTVSIDTHGAGITSVMREGVEYLWQGDPTYWKGRAPIMFPICGRLYDGRYTYLGKAYEMNLHGFARDCDFEVKMVSRDSITMLLSSSEQTKAIYPFDFSLSITYSIEDNVLTCSHTVTNLSTDTVLPYAIGGHPGFNVPVGGRGEFEDYSVYYGAERLKLLDVSPSVFCLGTYSDYETEDGEIRLRHDLFDNDALFFSTEDISAVTLRYQGKPVLTLSSSDMTHVGLWHKVRSDAPYVCIEPWTGTPSMEGRVDDMETKARMIRLAPNSSRDFTYAITVEGI